MTAIPIKVYSYGGCTSCGNSMWNWFRNQKLDVDHHNVQIPYEKREAERRAMELGLKLRDIHYPLIFINDKVIVGFQPSTMLAEITKLREV